MPTTTPNPPELAATPKRCPFCGRAPILSARPGTPGDDFHWYAFAVCHCGGYSSCAHKMAGADTEGEALRLVLIDWNTRRRDLASGPSAEALTDAWLAGVHEERSRWLAAPAATPPAEKEVRVPLTDEQIERLAVRAFSDYMEDRNDDQDLAFARAIEAAHGITAVALSTDGSGHGK